MSRRIIIGILILLIIGIIGGTVALIFSRLRSQEPTAPVAQITPLPQSNISNQPTINPAGDDDNDGLTNADEQLWGTSPINPDTDGDGFKDGEEVATSHNPTIQSPNDKLPAGFTPNQNADALAPSAPSDTPFESYFSDSVDVTGGTKNLTAEYARTIPDKDKSPLTLAQFVQAQPITVTLPKLNDAAITPEQDIPLAISQYINVAGNLDTISDRTRLSIAINDLFDNQAAHGFENFAARVRSFQAQLENLRVPPSAIQYHRLIIGYCELLAGTLSQIANYPNDQVKALVALRQLEAIDKQYYPLITRERTRLLGLSNL